MFPVWLSLLLLQDRFVNEVESQEMPTETHLDKLSLTIDHMDWVISMHHIFLACTLPCLIVIQLMTDMAKRIYLTQVVGTVKKKKPVWFTKLQLVARIVLFEWLHFG